METSLLHRTVYLTRVILLTLAAMLACGMGPAALADYEDEEGPVIEITAKQFEFSQTEIRLKVGVPVKMELRTADVLHGFNCPELGIRAEIRPGDVTKISFTPTKPGEFAFFCDIFCGEGHAKMTGKFIVEE